MDANTAPTPSLETGVASENAGATWPAIILIVAFGAAATAVVPQAVPVIKLIAARFPEGGGNVGWLISMPSAICALGALLAGLLVDRIGDRRMLLVGAGFVIAGDVGVYLAQTFTALLGWRLVEGIGYLGLTVGGATMLMRTTEGARRKAALALWSAHTPIGFALAIALVTPLATGGAEAWRTAFAGHGAIVIALVLAGALMLHAAARTGYRRGAGTSIVLRTPAAYRLGLASLCSAMLQTGFLTALPTGLERRFAMSAGGAASVAIVDLVLNAAAALGLAAMLRRGLPMKAAAVGGVLLLAAAWATYFRASDPVLAVGGSAVFCFALGAVNALVWGLLPNVTPTPAAAGATGGLVTQATYVGVLLGPPLVFGGLHGFPLMLAIVAGPALAAVLLVALPLRHGGQVPAH